MRRDPCVVHHAIEETKENGQVRAPGEQTDDPQIKKELKDLGERQDKIETMVNSLATKKNQ